VGYGRFRACGFHLEDAEAAQFDALAALHRDAHGVEHRIHGESAFTFVMSAIFETSFTMSS